MRWHTVGPQHRVTEVMIEIRLVTDIPHAVSDLTSIHRLTASERPLLAAITLKFTLKYRATQSCLHAGRSRPNLAKCLTIRLDRCHRQISQWMR